MDNSKQFLVSKNFLIIIIKRNCLVIKLRKKFFPYTVWLPLLKSFDYLRQTLELRVLMHLEAYCLGAETST